jgi:hypothetical protein
MVAIDSSRGLARSAVCPGAPRAKRRARRSEAAKLGMIGCTRRLRGGRTAARTLGLTLGVMAAGSTLAGCTAGAGVPAPLPDGSTSVVGVEGELHGAFLELECMSEKIELQFCVPRDRGMRRVSLKFGGDPARTYSVVLRVWGVVEGVRYLDGNQAGEHFYIGGRGGTPMTAEYTLEIAGERYHLNHFENNPGEHYTYPIEYTAPAIPIPGAANLVLSVSDPDNLVNTNHMEIAVANPPPALRHKLEKMQDNVLRWQYVYLEVASITPR